MYLTKKMMTPEMRKPKEVGLKHGVGHEGRYVMHYIVHLTPVTTNDE